MLAHISPHTAELIHPTTLCLAPTITYLPTSASTSQYQCQHQYQCQYQDQYQDRYRDRCSLGLRTRNGC